MEASTVEQDQPVEVEPDEGAATDNGAEATRSAAHIFAYSRSLNIGEGAEECEHADDGECKNAEHFHAVVALPNPLQHRDILEKARAAKARRKRAMRDAGDQGRPASDAFVTLEADLDDLLGGDREKLMEEIATREVRRGAVKRIGEVQESSEEKYENYWQDREEFERLDAMPEEERPAEEYEALKRTMDDFEKAVEEATERDRETEMRAMRNMSEEQFRERLRGVRIEGEASEAHLNAYYLWMAYIGTRSPLRGGATKRLFASLEDYRNAPPEVVAGVEDAVRDLEGRMQRGDAAGN